MQTVVVWDSVDADIKFFVVDKDISRLNNKYVNSVDTNRKDTDELCGLVYDEEGRFQVTMLNEFPTGAVLAGAKVIVAGFLP